MAQNQNIIITIALAIVIVIAVGAYAYTSLLNPNDSPSDENNDSTPDETPDITDEILLTINHLGENTTYALSDLKELKTETGSGRYIKTKLLPDTVVLGDIYNFTGITMLTLLEDINIKNQPYQINVTASDGWTTIYTMNQTSGIVDVYDENGNVTTNGSALMIVAYKENGEYYSEIDPNNEIGPLRIAFIGENTPITSSNLWSKMVKTIDVVYLK